MKKLIASISLCFVINSTFSQDKWTYVTETNITGSNSGTIQQGFVFNTSDASFYVVNEPTLQLVLTLFPKVQIFRNGSDYKLIIEDFDEPVICKKLINVIQSQIDGEFSGWEGDTIFKLTNGQIWQQSSFDYMYHYSYLPDVLIYEFGGSYLMKVAEVSETIEVKLLTKTTSISSDVIETRIDGDFEGWEGETIFKFQNGQIWQQSSYAYHYHYSYNPKVIVFKTSNGYEMQVDGVASKIKIKRLK